jgi:hypothetical protein
MLLANYFSFDLDVDFFSSLAGDAGLDSGFADFSDFSDFSLFSWFEASPPDVFRP